MPVQISGSVALVTGANRGLGQAYARELVRRGAAKVYGAARNPAAVTEPGVVPVALDITDAGQVAAAAAQCADVTLLVNNAGVMKASTFIGPPDPGRRAAGDGGQLLRHAEHVPGLRAGASGWRRRERGVWLARGLAGTGPG
jgi:NAD(P)-dependent dehydrogenase (short-subunit alcohol dehydrogenase family)